MGGVPDPVAWLLILAATLGALYTIWKRGIVPLHRFAKSVERIAEATPTLINIAEEFNQDGGTTLRDTVDRIEGRGERLEQGMIEALRIANETTERLIEQGDIFHEHLSRPAWSDERADVLHRLEFVEQRQERIVTNMIALLSTAADQYPLAAIIATAITDAEHEEPAD